jgi:hypothetical protein
MTAIATKHPDLVGHENPAREAGDLRAAPSRRRCERHQSPDQEPHGEDRGADIEARTNLHRRRRRAGGLHRDRLHDLGVMHEERVHLVPELATEHEQADEQYQIAQRTNGDAMQCNRRNVPRQDRLEQTE